MKFQGEVQFVHLTNLLRMPQVGLLLSV